MRLSQSSCDTTDGTTGSVSSPLVSVDEISGRALEWVDSNKSFNAVASTREASAQAPKTTVRSRHLARAVANR